MIHRGVVIAGVDPEVFAWVNGILSQARRTTTRISVLHDGTTIENVVGPGSDGVRVGDRLDDADALARRIRAASGVDLVTVLDRRGLEDLSERLVELARGCRSQGELLWKAREAWNTHPGVVQDPEPEPSLWPKVAAFLATIPDDHWMEVRVHRPSRSSLNLALRVESGLVVEVTARPPTTAVVTASLEVPAADLSAVLGADQPVDALRDVLASGRSHHHGLAPWQ